MFVNEFHFWATRIKYKNTQSRKLVIIILAGENKK